MAVARLTLVPFLVNCSERMCVPRILIAGNADAEQLCFRFITVCFPNATIHIIELHSKRSRVQMKNAKNAWVSIHWEVGNSYAQVGYSFYLRKLGPNKCG